MSNRGQGYMAIRRGGETDDEREDGMSYAQHVRWCRKHPTGGKAQYMGFSAGSGFWPSMAWNQAVAGPYVEACRKIGVEPINLEAFYGFTLSGHIMCNQTAETAAEYTRIMRNRAKQEGVSVEECVSGKVLQVTP